MREETYQDGVKLVGAVEVLNDAAHAGLRQATATPDLDGLVGDLVCHAGRAHLQQRNGPTHVLRLHLIGHAAHLVGDGLQPRLVAFYEGDHLCKPAEGASQEVYLMERRRRRRRKRGNALEANDGLVNEALAKDKALVGPL